MRVLIIDDEKAVADTLVLILQRKGYDATAAYSGPEALKTVESFAPDCFISDVIMPGINGIEVCSAIEKKHPACHVLLFAGQAFKNDLFEKMRDEGHTWEVLSKPLPPDKLLAKLASLDRGLKGAADSTAVKSLKAD